MSVRSLRRAVLAATLLLLPAASARAQYAYPYGYAPYGWGGWNSIGNVYSSYARGLGLYAMGAGIYNLDSAEARAINVNTNIYLNEYLYQCLLNKDRRLWRAKLRQQKATDDALQAHQDRLRNAPTNEDIQNGEALNVALTELTDPRYSYQVADVAKDIPIDGALLQQIPFRNASEAITFGLNELSDDEPPALLKRPEFADLVRSYRSIIDDLDKQTDSSQAVDPETVRKLRKVLQDADKSIKGLEGVDPEEKSQAERHVKTLLGLTYMLDGPSLDVYLADIKGKATTLAKLLVFMQSFNLRFGSSDNPNQNMAMSQLFQALSQAREEVFGEGTGTLPLNAPQHAEHKQQVQRFFSGMHTAEMDPEANRAKAAGGNP
jgi:hypothetical protein